MVFPYFRSALGAGLIWAAAGLTSAQDIEIAPAVPGTPAQGAPALTAPTAPGITLPMGTVPMGTAPIGPAPYDATQPAPVTTLPPAGLLQAGTPPSTTSAATWIPSHHWIAQGGAPGGDMVNGTRIGQPFYWNGPGSPSVGADGGTFGWTGSGWQGYGWGDPYAYHFGPGYHRNANYGHYRFPYHTYRAPWYFKGAPSYNRDTNYPW